MSGSIGLVTITMFASPMIQPRIWRRFDSARALSNLAGCSPITQASGKWKTVRMRTACVKPLSRTFRHWSFASLTHSKWPGLTIGIVAARTTSTKRFFGAWLKNGPRSYCSVGNGPSLRRTAAHREAQTTPCRLGRVFLKHPPRGSFGTMSSWTSLWRAEVLSEPFLVSG